MAPPPTLLVLAGANPQPLVAHLLDWAHRSTPPLAAEPGLPSLADVHPARHTATQPTHHVVIAVPVDWAPSTWQALATAGCVSPATQPAHPAPAPEPSPAPATAVLASTTVAGRGLPPHGLHRSTHGTWSITWAIGEPQQMLPLVACHASEVWLSPEYPTMGERLAKPIARLCLAKAPWVTPPDADTLSPDVWQAWRQAGFERDAPGTAPPPGGCMAHYLPRWPLPRPTGVVVGADAHAVVIGAGLAGAALCASLTRRGWRVDLLDQHAGPAEGASALPVGMLSEHVTAQDTMLSELSRMGLPWHWEQLQALVPVGAGWQPTQVANLQHGHALPAALVRPAALVQAWLAQAQATGLLRTHWRARVDRLQPAEPVDASGGRAIGPTSAGPSAESPAPWQVLDSDGNVLAQAPHVVVASAYGSAALLGPLMASRDAPSIQSGPPRALPLRPVKGQMSYGQLSGEPLAPHPLRSHGVYVPCYEDLQHPGPKRLWAMGSTYTRGVNDDQVNTPDHDRNATSLGAMLPLAQALMQQQQAQGQLKGWAQVRCASQDRLPLAGAVPSPAPLHPNAQLHTLARWPGLWTLTALGSRGLTLSGLGAELVVARMLGEPWPLTRQQADALDPARFALKASRTARAQKASTPQG